MARRRAGLEEVAVGQRHDRQSRLHLADAHQRPQSKLWIVTRWRTRAARISRTTTCTNCSRGAGRCLPICPGDPVCAVAMLGDADAAQAQATKSTAIARRNAGMRSRRTAGEVTWSPWTREALLPWSRMRHTLRSYEDHAVKIRGAATLLRRPCRCAWSGARRAAAAAGLCRSCVDSVPAMV